MQIDLGNTAHRQSTLFETAIRTRACDKRRLLRACIAQSPATTSSQTSASASAAAERNQPRMTAARSSLLPPLPPPTFELAAHAGPDPCRMPDPDEASLATEGVLERLPPLPPPPAGKSTAWPGVAGGSVTVLQADAGKAASVRPRRAVTLEAAAPKRPRQASRMPGRTRRSTKSGPAPGQPPGGGSAKRPASGKYTPGWYAVHARAKERVREATSPRKPADSSCGGDGSSSLPGGGEEAGKKSKGNRWCGRRIVYKLIIAELQTMQRLYSRQEECSQDLQVDKVLSQMRCPRRPTD